MSGEHKHGPECKEIFALLSQYLDSELPDMDCAEIESHMAACAPCMQFLESLRKTVQLCHGCGWDQHPAPLDERTKHQLFDAWQKAVAARKAG